MGDQRLVLGIFADEAAADAAVEALKAWDVATDDISLGAVGVLVVDDHGQVKEHKLGARSGGKGAGIGLVLAVIAPPTLLVGLAGGGLIGHFHHRGLGLSQDDRDRITADLAGGKAAVGVLVPPADVEVFASKLESLGAAIEGHDVTDEALEAVAAAAPDDREAPLTTA